MVALDYRAMALLALEGRVRPESAPFAAATRTRAYDLTVRVAEGTVTASDALFTCAECAKSTPFACFESMCNVREFMLSGWCQACQDAFFG